MSLSIQKNIKTRFCRSCTDKDWKCTLKWCKYARSLREIQPVKCKNAKCSFEVCWFLHGTEGKAEYAERMGFIERVRTPEVVNTNHQGIAGTSAIEFAYHVIKKLSKLEPIDATTNVGAKIMRKWGWDETKGLGKNEDGIIALCSYKAISKRTVIESKKMKGINTPVIFVKEGAKR